MAYANIDSYTDLLARVQEVAEDTDAEFVAYIPTSINLAEARLMKELDLEILSSNVEETTVASSRLVDKPDGYRATNSIFLVTGAGNEVQLRQGTADYLRDFAPDSTVEAQPVYYATDYNDTKYYVAPTPDTSYTLRIDAVVDVTPLSGSNDTNFFTSKTPEALFYATMVEQATFMKDVETQSTFEQLYLNAVQGLNNQGRRQRKQNGPSVGQRGRAGNNTLLTTE